MPRKEKVKKSGLDKIKTSLFILIIVLLVCAITLSGGLIYMNGWIDHPDFIEGPTNYIIPTKPPLDNETLGPDATEPEDIYPSSEPTSTGIYRISQKNPDILNILVAGSDARPGESRGRSDSMMILSYNKNTGKAKMISLLRDSLVPIDGHGWSKLNAAYAFGGPELTINTINLVFQTDIQYYVIVGFDGLQKVVDKMGGVRINITKEESDYYKRAFGYDNYPYGENVLLDGDQTLRHCRNRHLGGDWQRARRQRDVLLSLINSAREIKDPTKMLSTINEVFKMVKTNLSVDDIYRMGMAVVKENKFKMETSALPFEGTWKYGTYKKASIIDFDIDANRSMLDSLIYG